jgi:hypothetical protein
MLIWLRAQNLPVVSDNKNTSGGLHKWGKYWLPGNCGVVVQGITVPDLEGGQYCRITMFNLHSIESKTYFEKQSFGFHLCKSAES